MQKIAAQYSEEQVKILSLNAINPAEQAAGEANRYEIEFPVLICRQTGVVRDYEVTKLPHIIIIDQEGIIRASKLFLKTDAIKEVLDDLLASPADSISEQNEQHSDQ